MPTIHIDATNQRPEYVGMTIMFDAGNVANPLTIMVEDHNAPDGRMQHIEMALTPAAMRRLSAWLSAYAVPYTQPSPAPSPELALKNHPDRLERSACLGDINNGYRIFQVASMEGMGSILPQAGVDVGDLLELVRDDDSDSPWFKPVDPFKRSRVGADGGCCIIDSLIPVKKGGL